MTERLHFHFQIGMEKSETGGGTDFEKRKDHLIRSWGEGGKWK